MTLNLSLDAVMALVVCAVVFTGAALFVFGYCLGRMDERWRKLTGRSIAAPFQFQRHQRKDTQQ